MIQIIDNFSRKAQKLSKVIYFARAQKYKLQSEIIQITSRISLKNTKYAHFNSKIQKLNLKI